MGMRGRTARGWLVALLLLSGAVARADVPSFDFRALRADDDRVELRLSYGYKGYALSGECDTTIYREDSSHPEQEPVIVHEGSLGVQERSCGCYLPFPEPPPSVDATGQDCEPQGDGWVNPTSDCPEPYLCYCDWTCDPVYDAPCNSEYTYTLQPLMWGDPEAKVTVDWRESCPGTEPVDGGSGGGGDRGTGCGCSTAGALPHLIVGLLFLFAALLPAGWRRLHRR